MQQQSNLHSRPFGVKPTGNRFFDDENDDPNKVLTRQSLGHLAVFSDAQVLSLLELFECRDLVVLSEVNRLLYVFTNHDQLWKDVVLQSPGFKHRFEHFHFAHSWKLVAQVMVTKQPDTKPIAPFDAVYYSDQLHRPWQCATTPIDRRWVKVDNVQRRNAAELTVEQFVKEFEQPNRPVVITNGARRWKAMEMWPARFGYAPVDPSFAKQSEVWKHQKFRVGPVDISLEQYLRYAQHQHDENPLYLFDCRFGETDPQLALDYDIPDYFCNQKDDPAHNERDLFSLLNDKRPDFRWLVVGGERSGSKWHVDPNCTNAWNALIQGTKKWIMFPPGVLPPGVLPSQDGADVTQPISLLEWFLNFYDFVKDYPAHKRPIEFVAKEGDVVFVPCGWWHCVLNLDHTIAVTQNYISSSNLDAGLHFFENKKHLISGFKTDEQKSGLYDLLYKTLRDERPGLIEVYDERTKALKEKFAKKRKLREAWINATSGDTNKKQDDGTVGKTPFKFGFTF